MAEGVERKNVGFLYADEGRSALGTSSRVGQQLAGVAVLRRTLERLSRAERLDEIIVFCPAQQRGRIGELAAGTRAEVVALQEPVPISKRVQRRKWALGGWRGGLREATCFDEQSFTAEMVAVLREREVYTALAVPSEAVVIDPGLVDGLIEYHHTHGEEMRFTFSQAAVGLAGCAYRLDLLHELVQSGAHVGDLLAYDPDRPRADYVNAECTYRIAQELCTSCFRYVADTQRTFAALERLLEGGNGELAEGDAVEIVRAMEGRRQEAEGLPREVEVEINTEPTLRIKGYPHGQMAGSRGPMSLALFEKIVSECAAYDDICLTIGGFGEPLAHGEVVKMIAAAKEAGIFGINVETDGRLLKGELAEALLEGPADVISVYLDANSEQLYRQVKGQEGFEEVVGQLEAFVEKREAKGSGPMVAPHLVKTRATMGEMEEFYDRWLRRCGAAVIVGFNDFAGQIADEAVMDMSPPKRVACRRLFESMTILADGRVTICGQDFAGKCAVGNITDNTVGEVWKSQALEELREAHRQENYHANELCARCKEWHR